MSHLCGNLATTEHLRCVVRKGLPSVGNMVLLVQVLQRKTHVCGCRAEYNTVVNLSLFCDLLLCIISSTSTQGEI